MKLTIKKKVLGILMFGVLLAGCKKYLQIEPEDSYIEEQVFANESSAQQALNNLYIQLSQNGLYGSTLSMTYIELLGQQFALPNSDAIYADFYSYQYAKPTVAGVFESVWKQAYTVILKANKVIEGLQSAEAVTNITKAKRDILSGEALAVRALLHFDLLRLFGPVYSIGAENNAIPYYIKANAQVQPILKANQVLDSVLADLNEAASLLANDPIITQGIIFDNTDFYTGYRNRRLNYFAVKGLLARAYLYGGYNDKAHEAAKEVIDKGEKWFPWLDYSAIYTEKNNPDRIFSTEVIFGLENQEMYNNQAATFSADLSFEWKADPDRLDLTFEYDESDYRYNSTWIKGKKGYRNFFKYADVDDKSKNWRFLQPMLRKSELYYILAETEQDPDKAVEYLNSVRYNRGLGDITTSDDLNEEIKKEYQKEFYGEGQVFFFYKRKNMEAIPDGTSAWWDYYDPIYQVPIPESELSKR